MRLIRSISKVTFILLSPLVLLCAEGDGFITANESDKPTKIVDKKETESDWTNVVDPRLQASYEAHEREKRERIKFSKDIGRYATLKKKTFDTVALIHEFNLRGPHYDPTKFDEYTKWMRIYEKEILIAMDNYDAAAYVFFFEEFAKLSIQRAGMINPECELKDCECRNYKN